MSRGKFKKNIKKNNSKTTGTKTFKNKKRQFKNQVNVTEVSQKTQEIQIDLDVNKDATEFFSKNASYDQHYEAITKNRDKYVATLMAIQDYSIEIIPNARARSLAVAFACRDKELIEYLLNHNKQYGFTDILKSVSILDSKREMNSIEKKIARVAKTGTVMKSKNLGKLKNDINNLIKIQPSKGSCSGALAKLIRKWVRNLTETDLEYFALCLPTEPWKKLANILHLNPTKDFPNAPWFLPYCFGVESPKDSKLQKCRSATNENINQIVTEFDLPYSFIKNFSKSLNDESKKKIAQKEKLETILWYYEDLQSSKVNNIIKKRIENGETVELGYGKLMERLLMFKDLSKKNSEDINLCELLIPTAQKHLNNFKSSLDSPVVVIGDASGSMSVAIRTATIISSLLTAICSAKLTFFNDKDFKAKFNPTNIQEVLEIAYSTVAAGSTAPAASLVPFFDNKEVVKTFIIVTDEEENADGVTKDSKRWRFFDLFMEYRKHIFPSSLIFISFLRHQHSNGQMYSKFIQNDVPNVLQFKFCGSRPDLTKLDTILGNICSKSSENFSAHLENLECEIRESGLIKAFEKLKKI